MTKVRKQNIFNTTGAIIKYITFWLLVFIQMPIICVIPTGKFSVRYMRFFMRMMMYITGIRVLVNGKLIDTRPLMVIGNHISVFEMATFPVAFGNSFFGKKEMEKFPIVGWVSKKFGVIFVDRRPSQAANVLERIKKTMKTVSYPMVIFPEGTTTNGAYVKEFKSSLFNFVPGSDLTVQPIVMHYRHRDGSVISDIDLAEHFAYFNNKDQDMGPECSIERSLFGQIFHLMVIGGFRTEITVLQPVSLVGMDRKEIAIILHKIVSDKYMELKDKPQNKIG